MTAITGLQIGVVGAGLMGTEIALVHALAGYSVVLSDRLSEVLVAARDRLGKIYDKGSERGFYSRDAKDEVLNAIRSTTDPGQFASCDVVIEAVFEEEEVKARVLSILDEHCKASCIIATNTSTIPISVLASRVQEERRPLFVGTHYFSPVSHMKLVEVIPAMETAKETVSTAMKLCRAIGKTPIQIKDVTGFVVNRLLHMMMIEAVRLVEEGVASPQDIDLACRLGLGHPMGPFELMDATTSSLCLQAQQIMFDAYGERFRPRPMLKQRVRAGYVGGKDTRAGTIDDCRKRGSSMTPDPI